MRVIVYGMGSVGGVVAVALANAGVDVIGIARGAMLEAAQQHGVTLHHHGGETKARFPCHSHPSEIAFQQSDCILLCMKGQDTVDALTALRAAGVRDQPIFCCQNGVANERAALRLFPNVHGVTVMMPATLVAPGRVATFVQPRHGIFDIGRFPDGTDADDQRLAVALNSAQIAAFPDGHVMESKYGKLIMNLMNVVQAAVGRGAEVRGLSQATQSEGRRVLEKAGIAWRAVDDSDERRRDLMNPVTLPGIPRQGGSTWQSLARGTGRLETDYLNGEIVQIARLTGQAAPWNEALQALGTHLLAIKADAGGVSVEELENWLKTGFGLSKSVPDTP